MTAIEFFSAAELRCKGTGETMTLLADAEARELLK